jgi:ATP-dependent Clp protease protease subunit
MPKRPTFLNSEEEILNVVLQNAADIDKRRLYLTGEINENTSYRFMVALQRIAEADSEAPITIIVNSEGGSVVEGLAIYDAIKFIKNEVRIVGFGMVASMASIIMQAADKRVLAPNCEFLVHDIAVHDPDSMKLDEVTKLVRNLLSTNKRLQDILVKRSGLSLQKIKELCKADQFFTAQKAVQYGFADSVLEYSK